jgi:hypothetical protein
VAVRGSLPYRHRLFETKTPADSALIRVPKHRARNQQGQTSPFGVLRGINPGPPLADGRKVSASGRPESRAFSAAAPETARERPSLASEGAPLVCPVRRATDARGAARGSDFSPLAPAVRPSCACKPARPPRPARRRGEAAGLPDPCGRPGCAACTPSACPNRANGTLRSRPGGPASWGTTSPRSGCKSCALSPVLHRSWFRLPFSRQVTTPRTAFQCVK